jgi:WD40 repeat protein
MVIVWDVAAAIALGNSGGDASGVELHRLLLHKVKVQDLAFSANSAFLATLGGADDNNLVVWDVATGKAVCGSPAASHAVTTVRWYNTRDDALVTAGQYNMRSWEFDAGGRKLRPTECSLGSLKRVVDSLAIDGTDTFAYCGCKTGDILEVNLAAARFTRASKNRFSLGVSVITWVPSGAGSGSLIVGAGDGAIARVPLDSFGVTASAQLAGSVSSIAPSPDGSHVYVGTGAGNTCVARGAGGGGRRCPLVVVCAHAHRARPRRRSYTVDLESLAPELRGTAHADPVRDVAFPVGESALFVTASFGELRLWNAVTRAELLRIEVPNVDACCVAVMPNGSAIVSGWSDGKVRAFLPESGRLLYTITDAHPEGVSALTITHDNARLITGGKDGRVRVWNVAGSTQTMEMSFKEHKGTVTCVRVTKNDEEALSASVDGSCIIWNLRRGVRGNALFASTQFKSVLLHPDESQILTCGSDRKVCARLRVPLCDCVCVCFVVCRCLCLCVCVSCGKYIFARARCADHVLGLRGLQRDPHHRVLC